jgi:DNA-binding transcriptional LysR family regulator
MRRGEFDDLIAFIAIADHLSFRAAASQLGVTPSAVSHTMRQLEERLGTRLLNRTTHSVALSDAGLRLLERLRPAVDQVGEALEDLNRERSRPFGHLRIYATYMSAVAVVTPVWQASCQCTLTYTLNSKWARRRSISWRRGSMPVSVRRTERLPI